MNKMNEVVEAIQAIKPGTYQKLGTVTELPVKSEFKRAGIRIEKITERVARFGIDYSNISAVIQERAARKAAGVEPVQRANNNEWLIPNKVSYNTKTGVTCIRAYNAHTSAKPKTKYRIITPEGVIDTDTLSESEKNYVRDSYFSNKTDAHECLSVNIDNVYMLGNMGKSKF